MKRLQSDELSPLHHNATPGNPIHLAWNPPALYNLALDSSVRHTQSFTGTRTRLVHQARLEAPSLHGTAATISQWR